MAKLPEITLNERELAERIQVQVVFQRSLRVRLAIHLMRLAAWIGGFGFEAEEGADHE